MCQVAAHRLVLPDGSRVWLKTCNGRGPSHLSEGCLMSCANYCCARLEHAAES